MTDEVNNPEDEALTDANDNDFIVEDSDLDVFHEETSDESADDLVPDDVPLSDFTDSDGAASGTLNSGDEDSPDENDEDVTPNGN